MNTYFELTWQGPFRWYGKGDDVLFSRPEAKGAGIYLWTVEIEHENVVYYVGETGYFSKRFAEHTREYLSGQWRVYDTDQFTRGEKSLIWDGKWRFWRYSKAFNWMYEFLNKWPELAPRIYDFMGLFHIFLAPCVEPRLRERIEAEIALKLFDQKGRIGKFQDEDMRSHYLSKRTKEGEPDLSVIMEFPVPVAGLPRELSLRYGPQ